MTNPSYKENTHSLGYIEVLPRPTQEELADHYGKKYFQNPQGSYTSNYTEEETEYFSNIAKVADTVAAGLKLDRTMLDLGCGEGYFSRAFHEFGWKISCSDFSEFGISKHNKELLPFFLAGDIYGSIEHYKSHGNKFGLVNLQNVLEHVIDPADLLLKIRAILSKKSALRIMVPNDYSDFQLELVKGGHTTNTWFTPPEHLSYFNTESLANLLAHCKYKIVSMQATFPIEMFLANPHSNYWKNRELGKGAHFTRVFCENFLIKKDMKAYIEYSEAAAKLGFGRDLIAYAIPA